MTTLLDQKITLWFIYYKLRQQFPNRQQNEHLNSKTALPNDAGRFCHITINGMSVLSLVSDGAQVAFLQVT